MKKEFVLGIICTLFVIALAPADTIRVPGDYATIQEALDAAVDGDVVDVNDGIWTGPGNVDLVMKSAVTVESASGDPVQCIIDCGGRRAFRFYAGQVRTVDPEDPNTVTTSDATRAFVVSGFGIRNGYAYQDDPNVSDASQGFGGGIVIDAGYPVIRNCIFSSNMAPDGNGGGIYVRSTASNVRTRPRIVSCVFNGNSADYGGAIATNGPSDIINCLMVYNYANTDGGEMYMEGSASTVALCTLIDGSASGLATAATQTIVNSILWTYVSGNVSVTYSLLEDQTVAGGVGCIYAYPPDYPLISYVDYVEGPYSIYWNTLGNYYLNPMQPEPSPAVDSGTGGIGQYGTYGINYGNAFTDPREQEDMYPVDMGYHYPSYIGPSKTTTLTIIVDSNPAHGRVEVTGKAYDASGVYNMTAPIVAELTAIPDPGYRVRYWIGTYDDTIFDLDNPIRYTGVFNSPVTVHCSFEKDLPSTLNYPGQYGDLSYAIKVARKGDTIIIHPGVYRLPGAATFDPVQGTVSPTPCISIAGKAITLRSIAPDDPRTVAATVIEPIWNQYSTVIELSGCTRETVISGLTIRNATLQWAAGDNGSASNPYHPAGYPGSNVYGAGARILGAGTILNCVFENCRVVGSNGGNGIVVNNVGYDGAHGGWAGGGAMYIQSDSYYGDPLIQNVKFVNCTAQGGDGGNGGSGRDRWGRGGSYMIWSSSAYATYAEGTRIEKQANGGAVFVRSGNADFVDCLFDNCRTASGFYGSGAIPSRIGPITGSGGAIYLGKDQSEDVYGYPSLLASPSASFTNCTFTRNSTRVVSERQNVFGLTPYIGMGGAISCDANSTLVLNGCTFKPDDSNPLVGNLASLGGCVYWGGPTTDTGHITITDCVFTQNDALQGGAIYGQYGKLWMLNNTFDRNTASSGSIFGVGDPNAASVLTQGGAMYLGAVSAYIGDSVFKMNSVDHSGGALCISGYNQIRAPETRIYNNLFVGNTADRNGGAITCTDGTEPNLACNTIAYNTVTGSGYPTGSGGGLSVAAGSRAQIYDCLLWGNTAPVGSQLSLVDPNGNGSYRNTYATVKYSQLQGGESAIATDTSGSYLTYEDNNVSGSPSNPPQFVYDYATEPQSFVDLYALGNASPCVNAGSMDLENPQPNTQPVLPLGRYVYTLRVDDERDTGIIDLGYHRRKPGLYPNGDINYSGTVTSVDEGLLADFWLGTCLYPDWCEGADLNHDGTVNMVDQAIVGMKYGVGDVNAPTPDPARWLLNPAANTSSSITMTAYTAYDNSGNPVEYDFQCVTAGGHSSGWQSSSTFVDTGLTDGDEYGYRVRVRDTIPTDPTRHNVTSWSPILYAFVGEDGRAPIPNPSQWSTPPYARDANSIAMVATTAIDASGVEYYFRCESGSSGKDSGWQSSPVYVDSGLLPATTYTYTVKTRDLSPALNTGDYSAAMAATTLTVTDVNAPLPSTAQWYTRPFAVDATTVSMVAAPAEDPSGVEYYFECTQGGHTFDSGWQVTTSYIKTGLTAGSTYTFRVLVRDRSLNKNADAPSFESSVLMVGAGGGLNTPPTPNPMTWNTLPSQIELADGAYHIMQSSIATDVDGGVQYYFQCITLPTLSSGWIYSPSYSVKVGPSNVLKTYTWRVKARDIYGAETAWSGSSTAGLSTPPTPDPMAWDITPWQQVLSDGIYHRMAAAQATDTDGPVQYFFDCMTRPAVSSSWQSSPEYAVKIGDLGEPNSYSWRVKARDVYGVQTGWSPILTTGSNPPTPNPMTWDVTPMQQLQSTGVFHVMTAATANAINTPVEYYFECMTAPSVSSGWQTSSSYAVNVCPVGQTRTYTWRVKAKDALGSETAWSTQVVVGPVAPTPDPMQWDLSPVQEIISGVFYHSMQAVVATDPAGGIEYYFDCITSPSKSSGWQTSTAYMANIGTTAQTYNWRVKARNAFGTETAWSPIATAGATIPPTPNPMQWDLVPSQELQPDGVHHTMRCVTASDPDGGVQYYFQCTTLPSLSSGWQTSTYYSVRVGDAGTSPVRAWRVKAKDVFGNETDWSEVVTAGKTPPTPDPMTWDLYPTQELLSDGYYHTMGATLAVDTEGGVQYYFDCVEVPSLASGWTSMRQYTVKVGDTTHPHTYTWRVKARDIFGSETGWSLLATVGGQGTPPTPDPATWALVPSQVAYTDGVYHLMVATTEVDPDGGVEYYFDCVSNAAYSSGWVTSPQYVVMVGGVGQVRNFTWRVKARDVYGNETAWSVNAAVATVPPFPSPMTWSDTSLITVTDGSLTTGWPTQVLATETATGIYGYWHCMTATAAIDWTGSAVGIQYYFECITNDDMSSGWIDYPYYYVQVGAAGWSQTYQWHVRARDAWGTMTAWSVVGTAGPTGF